MKTTSKAAKRVNPIPPGYHTVTPYLVLNDASKAIEFYKKAFKAVEKVRMAAPGGKVGHAELQIGDSMIMLADEFPQMGIKSASSLGGSPVMLNLYVDDSDAWFERAVKAGATAVRPMKDQFYGDRSGSVRDPFGFEWHLSTHTEDVPPEEMKKRAEKATCEEG
jgi:PhnB protein